MTRFAWIGLALMLTGCPQKTSADSAEAGVVATTDAAPATVAAVVDAAPPTVKAATPATAVDAGHHGAATTAMKPPTPTADRFPRNRLKDGPCPTGFTEQPGVEEHSTCARNCKKDADCHGHTCVDSDIGDGKICSDAASKGGEKPAPHTCKSGELDDGDRCVKMCDKDADCPKGVKCTEMKVPNPSGGTSTAMVCQ